jgi:hypothetical protein
MLAVWGSSAVVERQETGKPGVSSLFNYVHNWPLMRFRAGLGPLPVHAWVAQCVTKGTQLSGAGPDISAGSAVSQTRGHSYL